MGNVISKDNVSALMDEQVVNEIFKDVERESKALSLFRRLPNMTSDKTKLRVSDSLPVTYFVDEGTDNGRKKLTNAAWKNVFITAEEIAAIVPIKENLLNDSSVDLWAEIKPQLVSSIAKTIDNAVFNGTGAPTSWGNGIIADIILVTVHNQIVAHIAKRLDTKRNAPPIGCAESHGNEIEIGIVGSFRQAGSAEIGSLEIHARIEQESQTVNHGV